MENMQGQGEPLAPTPLLSSGPAPVDLPHFIEAILVEISVVLPASGRRLAIAHPGSIDPLLDLVVGDPEQNLPYWAEVWPSGVALADAIAADGDAWGDTTAIELGCGVGVTAIAAVAAGINVIVTDYAPEALSLCHRNFVANGLPPPAAAALNWRDLASIGAALENSRFDLVLAADVLYERRDIAPLLDLIPQLLRPGGTLWLAEPGRPAAAEFLARAAAMNWEHESALHAGPWPDPADSGVIVGLHRLRPPAGHVAPDIGTR